MTPMRCGEMIVAQGAVAVIKPRKNRVEDRPYDKEMYKRRNVIERFFHRLKQYRRVAGPPDMINMQTDTSDSSISQLYLSLLKNVNTTL